MPQPPTSQIGTIDPKQLLTSEHAYATTLLVLFVDRYGTEALTWHPQTVRLQLEQDFSVSIPQHVLDKLLAAMVLVTTDFFYRSLPRFLSLVAAMVGNGFDPSTVTMPDSYECAWAISETLVVAPPERVSKDEPFAEEILHYIGAQLKADGFIRPPDILRIADGADNSDRVRDDWAADPEMFSAMYKSQTDKATQVEQTIRENMEELLEQVSALPLHNGNAVQLRERLRQDIKVPTATA